MGERTRNTVVGEVNKEFKHNVFVYSFIISASSFSYEYVLLRIEHGIETYPVRLVPDEDIKNEVGLPPDKVFLAKDEETFLELLKKIFGSDKAKRVITSLLAQEQEGTKI